MPKVARRSLEAVQSLLEQFEVIALGSHEAGLAGSLHAQLQKLGKTIGERDSMIAATAMANDLVMVTDNVREFDRMPSLIVENWRAD